MATIPQPIAPATTTAEPDIDPPRLHATRSHEEVLDALQVALSMTGRPASTPLLRPRRAALVVGPSGVGKSHLCAQAAADMRMPCLRLSFANWAPMTSRLAMDAGSTYLTVAAFLDAHPGKRLVLHLDELDKFRAGFQSEWTALVAVELFALLDRAVPVHTTQLRGTSVSWTDAHNTRLRDHVFLIGSGAWQELWQGAQSDRPGGDSQSSARAWVRRRMQQVRAIPEELLFRFSGTLHVLTPMTAQDFRRLAHALGLAERARRVGVSLLYTEAEASGLGMRWLECALERIETAEARSRHVLPFEPFLL